MTTQVNLGGSFTLPGTSMTLNRVGYGAMQLAGPQVWGPPRDADGAIAVLREAVAAGVNHIDTSDFYGPHVTNQIIKRALHPYPDGLVIVTKVGARRGDDKSWLHALSRQELIDAVHDNLRNLGLDALDVVNLRVGGMMGPSEGSIEEPLTVLEELKRQGLIRHLGLSNISPGQLAEAQTITAIVCVQNMYNVAQRNDDGFIDDLAAQVNMSTSTFHHHFRAVTAMSPLQYQKWLRLNEARRLMLIENQDAATVAFQVGYESPSQFSREYGRLFGAPPLRDITTLRQMTANQMA